MAGLFRQDSIDGADGRIPTVGTGRVSSKRGPVLPKVGTVTAYKQLATNLRDQILAGVLKPGDQLPTEPELTAAFGVSRSTAREALRSLEGDGLVRVKRGVAGGSFVTFPSSEQVSDSLRAGLTLLAKSADFSVGALMEVREILEVPGAELAALRHTDEDLERLRACMFDFRSPPPDLYIASQRFHTCVQQAAHNPMLDVLAAPIAHVTADRMGREREPGFWRQVDREHREISGYLEAHDQAGTREAMRAHLRGVRPAYERIDKMRSSRIERLVDNETS
jgi:GntR family transcriptional regulator, transcriptional repressor for pyruvate dehydrogenase complex